MCAFRAETHLETPASEDCNSLLCDEVENEHYSIVLKT